MEKDDISRAVTEDSNEHAQNEVLHTVTHQPQENAMSQVSQEFMRRMQAAAAKGPTLDEVRSKNVLHGKLIGCSYYASSSGMMYNSNTLLNISVSLIDGVQKILYTEKKAFQSTTATVYQPKQDVLAAIQELAERENLSAWSVLEYHDPFPCTDYSSSASVSLSFDDSSVGGMSRTSVSINVDAACQHGGGGVIQEFRNILETAVQDAEVLSQKVTEAPAYGLGIMGMLTAPPSPAAPVHDTILPDSAWKCECCGHDSNTGRFCTECGAKWAPPVPEGTWKCPDCGYDSNTGKFCSECGHKYVS
jgi:hypothetical protein